MQPIIAFLAGLEWSEDIENLDDTRLNRFAYGLGKFVIVDLVIALALYLN